MKEEKSQATGTTDRDERELFVESFKKVMDEIDANIKFNKSVETKTHKELKRMGAWNPSWIATQYCLICGKMCTLSRALRAYIASIGEKAHEYYEKEYGKS